MKKLLYLTAIWLILLKITQTYAAEPVYNAYGEDPQRFITFGAGLFYFDYKEVLTLPYKSQERGVVPQVFAKVKFDNAGPFKENGYVEAKASLSTAQIVYDGSTQSGTPVMDHSGFSLLQLEGTIHCLPWKNKTYDTGFFFGASYSIWNRDVANSYRETYSWVTLKVGPEFKVKLDSDMSVTLKAAFAPMVYGSMNLDGYYFDLKPRAGYEAEATFEAPFWKGYISVTPWIKGYGFGQSDSQVLLIDNTLYTAHEPSSDTVQYGVNLAYTFKLSQ